MPTYEYRCPDCKKVIETVHSIKSDPVIYCENCNSNGKQIVMERLISYNEGGFIIKQWTEAQSYKIKRDREKDRIKLKKKAIEKYGTGPTLQPNVDGEVVESWKEAKTLAKDKGYNADSYDNYIEKQKIQSIDNKYKSIKEML